MSVCMCMHVRMMLQAEQNTWSRCTRVYDACAHDASGVYMVQMLQSGGWC